MCANICMPGPAVAFARATAAALRNLLHAVCIARGSALATPIPPMRHNFRRNCSRPLVKIHCDREHDGFFVPGPRMRPEILFGLQTSKITIFTLFLFMFEKFRDLYLILVKKISQKIQVEKIIFKNNFVI